MSLNAPRRGTSLNADSPPLVGNPTTTVNTSVLILETRHIDMCHFKTRSSEQKRQVCSHTKSEYINIF